MSFASRRAQFIPIEFATKEQRDLFDYVYEVSLDHDTPPGQLLWGVAMGIAGEHPDWTFWQVVAELRRKTAQ